MSKNRRNFTPQQKADIVRRHLKDKVPVSTLAEELSIQPTQIYQWVAMVLEQAVRPQNKLHSLRREATTKELARRIGQR